MCKKVVVIGAGGHGKVIADIIEKSGDIVAGFLDDKATGESTGLSVIGKLCDITQISRQAEAEFIVAVGDNYSRKKISEAYEAYQVKWYTAIHPSAVIAKDVLVGKGTAIMANAVINSGSMVGNHAILNTASTIDHDNVIADFVHISPGAHLAGNVRIGEASWIGIGGIISNNVAVVGNCTIGAGTVVIEDISESGVYVGVPAKKIKT